MSSAALERGDAVWSLLGVTTVELLSRGNLVRDTSAAVYLSGSLAEGMGNSASDVDVYVVSNSEPTLQTSEVFGSARVAAQRLGQRRLAFEFWSLESADALATKLDALNLREGGEDELPIHRRLKDEEQLFVHRLRTGLPLSYGPAIGELRRRFDFQKLAQYLLRCRIHEIDHWHEDLVGMTDDGDAETGIFIARELLNVACEAYGHALGNTNSRRKWRLKVLAQFAPTAELQFVREQYWSLQLEPGTRQLRAVDAFRDYARRCIEYCNRVTELTGVG